MTVRVVRLGWPQHPQEGTRIGTVRRPPQGVPKDRFATDDWYDMWQPELSPSPKLVLMTRSAGTEGEWKAVVRAFRAEMNDPAPSRTLGLLATLSYNADFSVGCCCEDEARCHCSVLKELLAERGAAIA